MVVFNKERIERLDMKHNNLGFIGQRKQAIEDYVAIRKARMQQERDYFASEGDSDPERLAAQRERDKEFIQGLKRIGIGVLVFLVFYAVLRTVLGLW